MPMFLKPVSIRIPTGLLNPPIHKNPAESVAVVGGNVQVSQRVMDIFLGAIEVASASQGTMNNVVIGNENFSYYETICGGTGVMQENTEGGNSVIRSFTFLESVEISLLTQRKTTISFGLQGGNQENLEKKYSSNITGRNFIIQLY